MLFPEQAGRRFRFEVGQACGGDPRPLGGSFLLLMTMAAGDSDAKEHWGRRSALIRG